jgi:signal transduction histidine kinase
MARRTARVRNVHAILALSAGLVLLVLGTFGWMGWMMLGDARRREDVAKVLERSALEASADQIVASFRRNIVEQRAALRALRASSRPTPPAAGTVRVHLSRYGVEDVQPPGGLLFAPAIPRTEFDPEIFAPSRRLEFQAMQMVEPRTSELAGSSAQRRITLADVRTALEVLVRSPDRRIRAEALFRLMRVQLAGGDVAAAEASFARLRDEKRLGPSADLPPYGFLVRFLWVSRAGMTAPHAMSVALRPPPPHATRTAAAAALLDGLLSGEWLMRRVTYEFYEHELREMIGDPQAQRRAPDNAIATAELVGEMWNEWKATGFRTDAGTVQLRSASEPAPVLAITDATPGRMIVALHSGDALPRLFRERDAESAGAVTVMVTDEHGGRIFGDRSPAATGVGRLHFEPDLPWRLDVVAAGTVVPASTASGERYLLGVLMAVALLVSLACYAIARGVLRESAAGRLQSDFVSAVSHEFRSPLTTLRQLTELLADGRVVDEDRRRHYFGALQQETARLHQLVESLLDFGRMDAGRRPYQFESLDLSELVRQGIEEYRTQAGANGHAIDADFSSERLVVEADPEAMRRAVRNLLDNAVKYSPDAATVWVSTACDDRRAVVRVRDEGIGIPVHEQPRIFEEFVRGDAAKRACIRGTGIGLAMVKTIIRAHHGDVRVSSEVGRGSTFELRLPLCYARSGSAS